MTLAMVCSLYSLVMLTVQTVFNESECQVVAVSRPPSRLALGPWREPEDDADVQTQGMRNLQHLPGAGQLLQPGRRQDHQGLHGGTPSFIVDLVVKLPRRLRKPVTDRFSATGCDAAVVFVLGVRRSLGYNGGTAGRQRAVDPHGATVLWSDLQRSLLHHQQPLRVATGLSRTFFPGTSETDATQLSANVGPSATDPLLRAAQLHFSLSSADSTMVRPSGKSDTVL